MFRCNTFAPFAMFAIVVWISLINLLITIYVQDFLTYSLIYGVYAKDHFAVASPEIFLILIQGRMSSIERLSLNVFDIGYLTLKKVLRLVFQYSMNLNAKIKNFSFKRKIVRKKITICPVNL